MSRTSQRTAISPEVATVLLAALSPRGRDLHYAEFRLAFLDQERSLKVAGVLRADYNPEHPEVTPEVLYSLRYWDRPEPH